MMNRSSCLVLLIVTILAGCRAPAAWRGPAPRPARISHVVLVHLVDPADRDALIADCDAMLASIPGVVSFAAGVHLDTGRANVTGDYDVGLYIGFETEADYARYVEHPEHQGLLAAWKTRLESYDVFDVVDETP